MPTSTKNTFSKTATIKDVARCAKVSTMTVSRALRNPEQVSDKTLQLVIQGVHETGYVPNKLAGSLVSRRSNQVAILIPSISNRIFADLIEGVSLELEERGLRIITAQFHYSEERCQEQIIALMGWSPDAFIVVGAVPKSVRQTLRSRNIPVVEILELLEKPFDINIGLSHTQGGVAAGRHLLQCNYKNIACICSEPTRDKRALMRITGLQQVWHEQNFPDPKIYYNNNSSSLAGGHEIMSRILQHSPLPDAVFCTNDDLAFSAMMTCQASGLRIPEDIGFMGFNGLEISRQSIPTITTIHVDCFAMGRECAQLLLERLSQPKNAHPPQKAECVDVGFTLIQGQSTCIC